MALWSATPGGLRWFLQAGAACPKPAPTGLKPNDPIAVALKAGDFAALEALKCPGDCDKWEATRLAAQESLVCAALPAVEARLRPDLDDGPNGALLYPVTDAERALFAAAASKA